MSGSFAEIDLQLTHENAQDSQTQEDAQTLRPNVSVSLCQCIEELLHNFVFYMVVPRVSVCHFPQKSPIMGGSFAEIDLQLMHENAQELPRRCQ